MSDDLLAPRSSDEVGPNQNSSNPWDNPQPSAPRVPNPAEQDQAPLNGTNPPQSPPNGNNTVDPVQSWVAQHQKRDENGHFVKSEHLNNDRGNNQGSGAQSNTTYPIPVSFTQNNKYSEKNDPPLIDVKVTNPVTYLKLFLKKFFRNQDIDIRLKIKPFATIGLILAFTAVGSTSFSIGRYFFPNSSPIFHRAITLQGEVQKSESGLYYLSLPDNTIWTLRPKTTNINLNNVLNKQVLVKGNMTAEANVVEVKEVISFDKPAPVIYNPTPQPATNSAQPI